MTCAYYRDGKDNAELRDEIQMLVAQGHRGFKGKVGGLSLAEDIARMEIVRDVIGPDRDLMIDVNRAWDLKTAIEGAKLLEALSRSGWKNQCAGLTTGVNSSCWHNAASFRPSV